MFRSVSFAALLVLTLAACDDHKNARPRRTSGLVGAAETAVGASQGVVVPDVIPADKYVDRVIKDELGGFPAIGWLVPPHFLLADSTPTDVIALSSKGHVRVSAATPLTNAEKDSIRKTHLVACESDTVAMFETPFEVTRPERVLVASKPFRDAVVSGLEHPPLTPAQLAAGRGLLALGDSVRWRDSTFALTRTGSFFGVHAAYNRASGDLVASVLYYMNATGIVVARRVLKGADYTQCAGCSLPQYRYGLVQVYDVVNVFRLPGFPNPVLLVNTSTSEGRALSLFGVAPSGQFSEGRAYEYTVNCASRR
jgi:hypothetical protein